MALGAPMVACFVLIILGLIAHTSVQSLEEVQIQYDGEATPLVQYSGSTVQHPCPVGTDGQTASCTFSVKIERDMEPPILLSYLIDPFYQNYLQYYLSAWNPELEGR